MGRLYCTWEWKELLWPEGKLWKIMFSMDTHITCSLPPFLSRDGLSVLAFWICLAPVSLLPASALPVLHITLMWASNPFSVEHSKHALSSPSHTARPQVDTWLDSFFIVPQYQLASTASQVNEPFWIFQHNWTPKWILVLELYTHEIK